MEGSRNVIMCCVDDSGTLAGVLCRGKTVKLKEKCYLNNLTTDCETKKYDLEYKKKELKKLILIHKFRVCLCVCMLKRERERERERENEKHLDKQS
jgi:hypothetical protein